MIRERDIGGAIVRRIFTFGTKKVYAGHQLSREEVLSIPPVNRRVLIEKGMIEVYPKAPVTGARMIVRGKKKDTYDVVVGQIVNDHPLTLEEAEALVASPN